MITIDYQDLYDFIHDLGCDDEITATDEHIKIAHWYTRSDGCTRVLDLFISACFVHDFHYRTHHDLTGRLISRREADHRFRVRMQQLSHDAMMKSLPVQIKRFIVVCYFVYAINYFLPVPWVRWAMVRLFGARFWQDKTLCRI